MKILLLSAYDAESHAYWRKGLYQAFPEHDWTTLTLPARHFSWRIRGNSLTWSQREDSANVLAQPYDLCIATSMVDLATLRGLVPNLSRVPTLLYFHENQFAYPLSENPSGSKNSDPKTETKSRTELKAGQRNAGHKNVEPQMVQIYSALAADSLCFNSDFNRQTFLTGVSDLLKKLPDGIPNNIPTRLRGKSHVVPVGLLSELQNTDTHKQIIEKPSTETPEQQKQSELTPLTNSKSTTFVWNHRWEYDKGPDRLLAFINAMPSDQPLTFHILGQSFRKKPKEFEEIKKRLSERNWLGQWGYIESKEEYQHVLTDSQYVLSTAIHDFQGLSILEAVASGCIPLLPNRLVYPEVFTSDYLYDSSVDIEHEAQTMARKALEMLQKPKLVAPTVSAFLLTNVLAGYRAVFESIVEPSQHAPNLSP